MSEIEDIADMELNDLLEQVDLGGLDYIDLGELDVVESRTDGQDMSEELLGVVLAPADVTLSTLGMVPPRWEVWGTVLGMDLCQGSPPSLSSNRSRMCTSVVGWLDPLGIWTPFSVRDIVEVGLRGKF